MNVEKFIFTCELAFLFINQCTSCPSLMLPPVNWDKSLWWEHWSRRSAHLAFPLVQGNGENDLVPSQSYLEMIKNFPLKLKLDNKLYSYRYIVREAFFGNETNSIQPSYSSMNFGSSAEVSLVFLLEECVL